jgi:glycogen debranching enzyme
MEVSVGPPTVTIHFDDEVVVSERCAEMSSTQEQGYFAADTRLVSGYRLKVCGERPVLFNAAATRDCSARFEFTNPPVIGADGEPLEGHCLHLRLDRTIGHGVHEDYDLTSYARHPVVAELEVSIESDFADLFDVKNHRRIHRGSLSSTWDRKAGRLVTVYENGEFRRSVVLEVDRADSPPGFANGGLTFRAELDPGASWHTCLYWTPVIEGRDFSRNARPCHQLAGGEGAHDAARQAWVASASRFSSGNASLNTTIIQAVDDLAGMRMHRHDGLATSGTGAGDLDAWVPAAGIPWFVSLFGRDALTVSYQALALSPRFALGSLRALGALQADSYDDRRDMQPGKIEHEIRHGELAALHLIPHTPYYGTHEATTLYVLVAAEAWRWHADRHALDEIRPHVERALSWIDTDGDIDGDGLQEYRTRAPEGGYYNQGWKDSGDGIVDADGAISKLPIALCEHQGLVVAAKRAWASVLEDVYRDHGAATRLRGEADRLAEQVETRFWWEEEGTYYLGLDGDKRPIASVASNPGQLLWLRVVEEERAGRVARRLLAPDMWSGWGIRTLSAAHVAYNPFSYQVGSVWPHDNAFAVAGFRNYRLETEAHQVARGLLDAAECFAAHRLPELFAGLDRDMGAFPVQYLGANVPQAWAAGAVPYLMATLLGLEADAPAGRLRVRPALPEWLAQVSVHNLTVGQAKVDLRVRRSAGDTHELDVLDVSGAQLEVDLEP